MEVAALIAWVLASIVGFYLMLRLLASGGLTRQATKITRFPAALTLSHVLLGAIGLGVWVCYLVTTETAYAWGAFAALVVVSLLGFTMLTRWLVGEGGRHARGAEKEVPIAAVFAHGSVAIMTFVLVLFAALVVGRG